MSHVRMACSRTEKINKECKNALWLFFVHNTVRVHKIKYIYIYIGAICIM